MPMCVIETSDSKCWSEDVVAVVVVDQMLLPWPKSVKGPSDCWWCGYVV